MGNKPANTIFHDYKGQRITVNDAAIAENVSKSSIWYYLRKGKTLEESIELLIKKNSEKKFVDGMKLCPRCKIYIAKEDLTKRGHYCKKCHCDFQKIRRSKMSENELKEKKERAKINSAKQREEYIKLTDINEIVKIWCRRWLNSSGKTRNPGRKDISFDFLYNKCIESMKLFPYMTFKNIIEDGGRKAFYASVDRIDSSKIYSEDNIVVIPLWLNSAKLDMTIDELKEVIGSAPFKLLYEQW